MSEDFNALEMAQMNLNAANVRIATLSALCAQMAAALVKCRVAGLSTDGPYDARREASDAIDNALTAYRTLSPDPQWQRVPDECVVVPKKLSEEMLHTH